MNKRACFTTTFILILLFTLSGCKKTPEEVASLHISGSVGLNGATMTGLPGVVMEGLPGSPVTDESGYYTATVAYGWSGTVTPIKESWTFHPANRSYSKVDDSLVNQNYNAEKQMLTISGKIAIGGRPVEGVMVSASRGGRSDVTDAQGRYSVKVPYGWSGTITLTKEGFDFVPPNISYTNVIKNITNNKE